MPADAVELTLRLDPETAQALARRAAARGQSPEEAAAEALRKLALWTPSTAGASSAEGGEDDWRAALTPFTRRLLEGKAPADFDEEDYYRYLEVKHR